MIVVKRLLDNDFIKFCIIGTFGLTAQTLLFYLFYNIINIYYVLSSILGAMLASILVFFLNRTWTFKVKSELVFHHTIKFALMLAFSYVLNGISLLALTELLILDLKYSYLLTICITTAFNYSMSKFWVFKD